MSIQHCYNFQDFRRLAKRRLPTPLFHYIDGAAENEWTATRNTQSFDTFALIPNALADLSKLDISTRLFGRKLSMPLFCAPTAMTRLFHYEGEYAVARAAAKAETLYSLSTLSTVSIEEIGKLSDQPKMFQIYIHKDRGLTREFIERCKAANFDALCLTVDTLVTGNRERDLHTGLVMPPRLTLKSLFSFVLHPHWSLNYLMHDKFELANVKKRMQNSKDLLSVMSYVHQQFDRSVVWKDAEDIIQQWGKPFAIKGILSVNDAKRAADIGASAVMLSNHGGRQLDGCAAPFDVLPAVADAVADRLEIILDGGVQRGSQVLKALALGAKACSIGRGYLFPLTAGGQAGVERALDLFRKEIERNMILMGCASLNDLSPAHLIRVV
ncbi:alpha-hydroxy acid oxidase [uncultured Thiothrix sp.]|uniref:alpha-hydroxy acid oxidase n=1 Tax=uncultured Thiothrix sp. TaxID=223185 RepID=UPI0026249F58|nr:alpha-hydroxy acid oxidase [uncultured Thiothrix sp.]HMT93524.1 alpha-hydroxy acid oxidase [Thiolinea sp.]